MRPSRYSQLRGTIEANLQPAADIIDRHGHQPLAGRVVISQLFHFGGHVFNAFIQPVPSTSEVFDQLQHARREHVKVLDKDVATATRCRFGSLRSAPANTVLISRAAKAYF